MDKVNDLAGGLFAGAISSAFVAGIVLPVIAALIVIVLGHFVRRYLHKKFPIDAN